MTTRRKRYVSDYSRLGAICAQCVPDRPPKTCLCAQPYQNRNPAYNVLMPCGFNATAANQRENFTVTNTWIPNQQNKYTGCSSSFACSNGSPCDDSTNSNESAGCPADPTSKTCPCTGLPTCQCGENAACGGV